MEYSCICCTKPDAACHGCPLFEKRKSEHEEFEKWKTECINTFLKPKKTNFDVLNEFVKKTFGFDLDKDILNHECIIGAQYGCQKRWGGPICEGCEYRDYWSLEYKGEDK